MPAVAEISPGLWAGFILLAGGGLAVDWGGFRLDNAAPAFRSALLRSLVWVALAAVFAGLLFFAQGRTVAGEFTAGYLLELSLSLDNLLVIALIFQNHRISPALQQRVLRWGLASAVVLRGALILTGAGLVRQFDWVLYVFGAFLLVVGARLFFSSPEGDAPPRSRLLTVVQRFIPLAPEPDGGRWFTRWQGRRALTPLAVVLLLVESSDVLFAVDSVPAVFSVTRSAAIIFTSNVFALIGLRSLYFLLSGAVQRFHRLTQGLALILTFVGLKMLLDPHDAPPRWFQFQLSTGVSLLVLAGLLAFTVVWSLLSRPPGEGRR
jgi:tellurite resistance protein TerC